MMTLATSPSSARLTSSASSACAPNNPKRLDSGAQASRLWPRGETRRAAYGEQPELAAPVRTIIAGTLGKMQPRCQQ